MPQIKIRGVHPEQVCQISTEMVDNLTTIIDCPRDYFTIECIHSTAIRDGAIIPVPPFVEVAWFDRGQEVQDLVAREITTQFQSVGIESLDVAFIRFEKPCYYENGEHF